MKTTVEIADSLFWTAKKAARKDGVTLDSMIESGLRLALQQRQRQSQAQSFRLRDGSVGGNGLRSEWEERPWSDFRAAAYARLSSVDSH